MPSLAVSFWLSFSVTLALVGLTVVFGYRRRRRAHLMLALYRSGRRDAAVNAYGRLHTCLIGELGLEPSAPLRRLHRTMLAAGRDGQDLDTSWHEATTEGRHRIVTGDFVRGR